TVRLSLTGDRDTSGHEGCLHLLLVALAALFLTESSKHEPQPHPPFGDGAVFLAGILLGRAFVSEALLGAGHLGGESIPDAGEFSLDQLLGQLEAIELV